MHDKPTKRVSYVVAVIAAALLMAGCNDNPAPSRAKCYEVGDLRLCPTKVNGEDCTAIEESGHHQELRCKGDAIDCADEGNDPNASGNVCKVRVGDVECVAVLPDGGKSPKDYKDFTTCPTQPREEAPDA